MPSVCRIWPYSCWCRQALCLVAIQTQRGWWVYSWTASVLFLFDKVHIFWEGHKILQNLHRRFDWHYSQVSIKQAACLTTYVHMYYFFCCISQWLKTKCQISLFWFLLLSYNLKRKKKPECPFFFWIVTKNKTKKVAFWFLVTGWWNKTNINYVFEVLLQLLLKVITFCFDHGKLMRFHFQQFAFTQLLQSNEGLH